MEGDTCRDHGGGVANMLLQLALVVWASKLSTDDLWVWASKPRMKFGVDFWGGTWRHHEACVDT